MATSSIFTDFVISTEEEAEKLADALEKAEKLAEAQVASPVHARDMGREEIRRVFGRAHE